ncbi:MAG: hypothetical protein PVG96_00275 [Desulfobacterales bacterium]|jgi:hypothetical protein
MKVQSTGLGKTVMIAQFKELLNTDFDKRQVLQMTMEATEPLHWTIKVYMEPNDLRKAIVMGLKPSVLWKVLLAAICGRFSLFRKTGAGPEDSPASTKTQQQTSSDNSTETETGETPGPLANLKESAGENKPVSPLAKLKE